MSKVYAVRSVAKKHIVEQCMNCNLKKNSNGLYNHDNVVKVRETIIQDKPPRNIRLSLVSTTHRVGDMEMMTSDTKMDGLR